MTQHFIGQNFNVQALNTKKWLLPWICHISSGFWSDNSLQLYLLYSIENPFYWVQQLFQSPFSMRNERVLNSNGFLRLFKVRYIDGTSSSGLFQCQEVDGTDLVCKWHSQNNWAQVLIASSSSQSYKSVGLVYKSPFHGSYSSVLSHSFKW